MNGKPLIGLNTDFRPARDETSAFSFVYAGYFDGILAAGGVPVIVPPLAEDAEIERALDALDAFVLVGGQDLDPRRDGYMVHPSMRLMDPRRESFDRRLMQAIARRRMPVYGIGAGMQLLNVSQGGTLFFHIPEDLPKALPHRDPIDLAHRHALEVVSGTLMGRIYGEGEIRVNSNHHMAIDDLAPGFRVTARCPDGVVEAIESTRPDWFALGTQFHPQADSASALDRRIFEEFLEGATGVAPAMRLVA